MRRIFPLTRCASNLCRLQYGGTFRYCDLLEVGTKVGAEMAIALVDLLQPLNALNTHTVDDLRGAGRAGRMVQQALDCSWYTLHYAEEEVHCFMGEGTFSFPLDLELRVSLL